MHKKKNVESNNDSISKYIKALTLKISVCMYIYITINKLMRPNAIFQ